MVDRWKAALQNYRSHMSLFQPKTMLPTLEAPHIVRKVFISKPFFILKGDETTALITIGRRCWCYVFLKMRTLISGI